MAQRWLKKINEKLKDRNYYEAHQIYRVAYYRLLKDDKFPEIYELLLSGSLKLFDVNEHLCGADLASLLIDAFAKVDSPRYFNRTESEIIDNMQLLFMNILPKSSERSQFITKILTVPFLSSVHLRKCFAEVLWKEKNYSDSLEHFMHSSDSGANCALMLVEYQMDEAYSNEVDLMIAQFVLQVLCIGNEQLAFTTFYFYTLNHPKIECTKPPFTTPLLNFISFLIMCIENFRGDGQKFGVLCRIYKDSIDRDPRYKDYLEKIGQLYFGIEKKPSELISNLLKTFMDISVDDKDEDSSISSSDNTTSNSNQDILD